MIKLFSLIESKIIAEKILQLNSGYNKLLKQPYSFYDLKRIRQELKELQLRLTKVETQAADS